MGQENLKEEIENLISELIVHLVKSKEEHLDLTIASNSLLTQWAYQTGDNSYSGPCYHFPYWAVTTIFQDSNPTEIALDLIDQLLDLIPEE